MSDTPREVYFETTRVGNALRCTALDSVTGIEVFAVAPLSISQRDLETLALRKLERRLATGG